MSEREPSEGILLTCCLWHHHRESWELSQLNSWTQVFHGRTMLDYTNSAPCLQNKMLTHRDHSNGCCHCDCSLLAKMFDFTGAKMLDYIKVISYVVTQNIKSFYDQMKCVAKLIKQLLFLFAGANHLMCR